VRQDEGWELTAGLWVRCYCCCCCCCCCCCGCCCCCCCCTLLQLLPPCKLALLTAHGSEHRCRMVLQGSAAVHVRLLEHSVAVEASVGPRWQDSWLQSGCSSSLKVDKQPTALSQAHMDTHHTNHSIIWGEAGPLCWLSKHMPVTGPGSLVSCPALRNASLSHSVTGCSSQGHVDPAL
jgi:hypothetical protein